MLLEIHDGFRRASGQLRREVASPSVRWDRAQAAFEQLSRVLHHHHHAEEVMLFPRLVRSGVAADALGEDHRRLMSSIAAVHSAFEDRVGVAEALSAFDTLLTEHLDDEEAVAIPHLLRDPRL
ncbi:MAG: hemerythrin domain-containing protein [Myxococcota bacterium]